MSFVLGKVMFMMVKSIRDYKVDCVNRILESAPVIKDNY